jgi:cystathionine gamma-synthase
MDPERINMAASLATQAVHGGEERHKPFGALTTPIIQSSTFTFRDTAEILEFMHAKEQGAAHRDEYGRYSNPTQTIAEHKLAALDGGEQALLFASGMSAITTTLLTLLSSGDHLLLARDTYHRTREFALALLSRLGIETSLVPVDDPQAIRQAIRPNTRLLFAETPTNPYLRVLDLPAAVEIARAHGLLIVVDSTFATPVNFRPLEFGADLVVQSATKYLGGHNDLLAGAVIGSSHLLADIQTARGILGGVSNPQEAYLLLRGLKTLELRVRRQNENGLQVARFLEDHPSIARVYYPGLESHPDYAVAQTQLTGFGGVVSFEIDGDFDKTGRLIDRLHLPYIGPTLGGVESIIEQPAALFSLEPVERKAAGIKDNLVRYALGIEAADDIIADLRQALAGL